MTWHERVTVCVILAVFLAGWAGGAGWLDRSVGWVCVFISMWRSRRLVDRMGRERSPW